MKTYKYLSIIAAIAMIISLANGEWFLVFIFGLSSFLLLGAYGNKKQQIEDKEKENNKTSKHVTTFEVGAMIDKAIEDIKSGKSIDIRVPDGKQKGNARVFELDKTMVEGMAFQFLESFHLSETSNNPDIVIARIEFAREKSRELKSKKENDQPKFQKYMNGALDKYKSMYYDVIPSASQLNFLFAPEELINNYQKYYCSIVNASIERYLVKQFDEVDELKTKSGKLNRLKKINDKLNQFFDLAKKYENVKESFKYHFKEVEDKISEIK